MLFDEILTTCLNFTCIHFLSYIQIWWYLNYILLTPTSTFIKVAVAASKVIMGECFTQVYTQSFLTIVAYQ